MFILKKILIILFILFSINVIAEEEKKELDKDLIIVVDEKKEDEELVKPIEENKEEIKEEIVKAIEENKEEIKKEDDVAKIIENKKKEIKEEKEVEEEKEKEVKSKIVVLPSVYTNSDDEFFIGGMTHYFKIDENYHEKIPVRTMNLKIISETKTRYKVNYNLNQLFYKKKYRIKGNIDFGKSSTIFYGIGNDTNRDNELKYTKYSQNLEIIGNKLFGKFEIGPVLSIKAMKYNKENTNATDENSQEIYDLYGSKYLLDEITGEEMDKINHYGSSELTSPGLGINIKFDNRENIYDTRSGSLIDFKFLTYPESFNGEQGFVNVELDCRSYFEIFKNNIIAMKYKLIDNYGDTPFYYLTSISGEDRLKGIVENRYIDKSFMMLQTEYRFPIFNNVSGALFASTGDVAEEIGKFKFEDFKFTGGLGLRMKIDEDYDLNVSLDLAINDLSDNKDKILFYFNLGQSF